MNLLEKSIPYKSIIMRCESINRNAFSEAEECFSIVKYRPEMKSVWIEIQKAAGQFEGYSDADIADYFEKTFLFESSEISERCFFLKDNIEEAYIGTCCAWFSNKGKRIVPVLHWLAVVPTHRNRGCARILITCVLKYFERKYGKQAVYLHTQPESYQAIKLYNDFGFNITKEDSYGYAVNEYEYAMGILKDVMNAEAYKRLKNTAVQ